MATGKTLSPDVMRVLDTMSSEVSKSFMKAIQQSMNKEAASFFKNKGGQKDVIGETKTTKDDIKHRDKVAAKQLRELQKTYKKGEDTRSKIYLWFLKKSWGPKFLNLWFKLWNNKIFFAIRNSFERVTGFFKQQFTDIFGEFMPIIDLMKDTLTNLGHFTLGALKFAGGALKTMYSLRKKLFGEGGLISKMWTRMSNSFRGGWQFLGKKLDKIIFMGKKSQTAKTIIVGDKRGRGRPRKTKEVVESGIMSLLTITALGGMLGRLMKVAVPIAMAVAGFGVYKKIKDWLNENPEVKEDINYIAGEIKDGFKFLFQAAWDGFKSFATDAWKSTPDWARILMGGAVGGAVLKGSVGKGILGTLLGGVGGALSLGAGMFKKTPPTTSGEPLPLPGSAGGTAAAGKAASKIGGLLKGAGKLVGKLGLYGFIAGLGIDIIDEALSDDDELIAKAKGKDKAGLTDKMQSFIGKLVETFTFGGVTKEKFLKSVGIDVNLQKKGMAQAGMSPVSDMPRLSSNETTGGNLGQQLNNPGNIKSNQETGKAYIKAGLAEDSGRKAKDGGTFLKFKTPEAGWSAMYDALRGSFTSDTVDERMNRWSNKGYGAAGLGLGSIANKKMKDLSDDEMKTLMYKMATREGYYNNTKGGAKLPAGGMGGGMSDGSSILSLLSGGMLDDPLFRKMFGDEISEMESGTALTREELSKNTGGAGDISAMLQQQESELIKQQAAQDSAIQSMPNQMSVPVSVNGGQSMSANMSGSTGTPDPQPDIMSPGTPWYLILNNNFG